MRREATASKRASALTSETTLTASVNLEDLPNAVPDPDHVNHDNCVNSTHDDINDESPLAHNTDDHHRHNEPVASTSCDYLDCKIPTISYSNEIDIESEDDHHHEGENNYRTNHNHHHHQEHQDINCISKDVTAITISPSSIMKQDVTIRDVL